MSTDARGIIVHRSGWAGTVTASDGVDSAVVTLTGHESAHAWMLELEAEAQANIDASYTLSITTSGYYRVSCDVACTLVFSSSAVAARFGFSSASYASATTRTAEAIAPGSWYPYATDGIEQGLVAPQGGPDATRYYGSGYRPHVPAWSPAAPTTEAKTLRTSSHGLVTAVSYSDTPAKVDVIFADMTRKTYHLTATSADESGIVGLVTHRLSVLEAL